MKEREEERERERGRERERERVLWWSAKKFFAQTPEA
jgi:hypothetical protein